MPSVPQCYTHVLWLVSVLVISLHLRKSWNVMEKAELLEEGSVGREEECIVLIHVRNVLARNKVYKLISGVTKPK